LVGREHPVLLHHALRLSHLLLARFLLPLQLRLNLLVVLELLYLRSHVVLLRLGSCLHGGVVMAVAAQTFLADSVQRATLVVRGLVFNTLTVDDLVVVD